MRVAVKASTSIDVRLESKNPRGGFDEVARGATAVNEWTTIDVTKPHEAKAEEWRLSSKHDGTVEARFYESRVDSDWALELHCLHNLAATKELLGDDGSDEKEGAQRIRNRQGAARFDRVSGAVHQLEALSECIRVVGTGGDDPGREPVSRYGDFFGRRCDAIARIGVGRSTTGHHDQ